MLGIVAAMVGIALWEVPNLRSHWDRAERWAFWVFWGAVLLWAVLLQMQVPIPTMTQLTNRLFQPLSKKLLTPKPNIYW